MKIFRLYITFLFILFSVNLYTQKTDLILKTKAYHLTEDKEGFIWVGTTEGVFKINPNDFSYKKFTTQDGLPNNDIWDLCVDSSNRLWYFSKNIYQGYIKNSKVYKFKNKHDKVISPSKYHIINNQIFYEHNLSNTFDDSLRYMHLVDGNWKFVKPMIIKKPKQIFYNPFDSSNYFISPDSLYILKKGTNAKALAINNKPSIPQYNNLSRGGIRESIIYIPDKKGAIFHNTKNRYVKYIYLNNGEDYKGSVQLEYKQEQLHLFHKQILIILDTNFNIIRKYDYSSYNPNHALLDKDGNIWLACENGIFYIPSTVISTKYQLNNQNILYLDTLQFKIIANTEWLIYKEDNHQFTPLNKYKFSGIINPKKFILNHDSIFSIISYHKKQISYSIRDYIKIDNKEVLLQYRLNTYKNGNKIFKFEKTGLWKVDTLNSQIYIASAKGLIKLTDTIFSDACLKYINIKSIISYNNFLLLGTDGFGLHIFSEKTGAIQIPFLEDLTINQIKVYDSLAWLATNQGIKVLDIDFQNPENSKIINSFIEEDGLKVNYSNCLLLYDSNLYVGCESGISVLDLRNSYYYQKPKISFDTRFTKQQNKLPIEFEFHSLKSMSYFYSLDNQKSWTKIDGKRFQLNDLDKENTNISFKVINHHQIENIVDYQIKVRFEWYQKTSWQIVLGIAGSILLYLFFRLGYNISQKQTKKRIELRHQLNNLKLEALRSQMNPHFVNNALNSILYLIQEKDAGFAEKYLIKFARLMRLYFNFSSAEFITIQEELEVINTYISIEKLRFEDKFDFKIDIDENIDTESEEIPSLITQPFIENAINHGIFHIKHKGLIKLSFKRLKDDSLCISIWDNGIGYLKSLDKKEKDDEKHSSKTITDRIETLNNIQKYNVESSIHDHGNGTEIKILIG